MTAATLLFLPANADDAWHWLRIADDAAVTRGEGLPEASADRLIAVAPADAVTLHWAALPDRSAAQAVAAARIVVAEASAAPIGELHVAVGHESHDERPIGVVTAARMHDWLAALAAQAIDPYAIVPAPMLLPRPDEGFVRADFGGRAVVRGPTSGFADEARLTELITGGAVPETLGRDAVDAAMIAAIGTLALDLRQGPFARRTRRVLDWGLIRRLAVLAGMILLATLAIDVVRITLYSLGADALEARADTIARQGLPRGETTGDADRLLVDRLSRLRGPGQGFSGITAAVFAGVRGVSGSEVTALTFEPNGDLRVTVSAAGEAQANLLKSNLEQSGFAVTASTFESVAGRVSGQLTVRAQ